MDIKIGDKLVVTKKMRGFFDEGTVVEVAHVGDDGMISFTFGENSANTGFMDSGTCEEHFEKIVEKPAENNAPTITHEHVEEIMANSDIEVQTVFDKCTIVSCRLPNGFVIVESSACVSPENYDKDIGVNICLNKIMEKVWELEGYRLQAALYRENNEDYCNGDCEECPYSEEYYIVSDGCLDADIDCDDCEDHECPYNPNK